MKRTKRTYLDRKFSQGDANSDAYRANWDATFGTNVKVPDSTVPADLPPDSPSRVSSEGQTESGTGV